MLKISNRAWEFFTDAYIILHNQPQSVGTATAQFGIASITGSAPSGTDPDGRYLPNPEQPLLLAGCCSEYRVIKTQTYHDNYEYENSQVITLY